MNSTSLLLPIINWEISQLNSPILYTILSYTQIESQIFVLIAMILQSIVHNPMLYDNYKNEYQKTKESNQTIEDLDPRLKKRRDQLPIISEDDEQWHKEHQAISINGYWYDIGTFIPHHPGGDIIKTFIRADATASFYGMHNNADLILKKRFPCAIHKSSSESVKKTMKMNHDFWKLWTRYNQLGMFEPSMKWLARVLTLNFVLFATMFYICYNYPKNWFMNGVFVGMVIHAGGFMVHDSCHSYVCKTQFWSKVISWISGATNGIHVFFGNKILNNSIKIL